MLDYQQRNYQVSFVLTHYSARHTYDEFDHKKAANWVLEHQELIQHCFQSREVSYIDWKDIVKTREYIEARSTLETELAVDQKFGSAIKKEVLRFLKGRKLIDETVKLPDDLSVGQLSKDIADKIKAEKDYLLEESAVFKLWQNENYDFLFYSNGLNYPLNYLQRCNHQAALETITVKVQTVDEFNLLKLEEKDRQRINSSVARLLKAGTSPTLVGEYLSMYARLLESARSSPPVTPHGLFHKPRASVSSGDTRLLTQFFKEEDAQTPIDPKDDAQAFFSTSV